MSYYYEQRVLVTSCLWFLLKDYNVQLSFTENCLKKRPIEASYEYALVLHTLFSRSFTVSEIIIRVDDNLLWMLCDVSPSRIVGCSCRTYSKFRFNRTTRRTSTPVNSCSSQSFVRSVYPRACFPWPFISPKITPEYR